jgi:hypothetical protein
MTPQQPKGEQASADAGVMIALRLLERAMVAHGAESKKGGAINRAIQTLVREFGRDEDKSLEIMPAEVKTALMAPAGEPGGGPQGPGGGGQMPGAGMPPGAA